VVVSAMKFSECTLGLLQIILLLCHKLLPW